MNLTVSNFIKVCSAALELFRAYGQAKQFYEDLCRDTNTPPPPNTTTTTTTTIKINGSLKELSDICLNFATFSFHFQTRNHTCEAPIKSLRPSVRLYVTILERLNVF
jgi:hypothetical protein